MKGLTYNAFKTNLKGGKKFFKYICSKNLKFYNITDKDVEEYCEGKRTRKYGALWFLKYLKSEEYYSLQRQRNKGVDRDKTISHEYLLHLKALGWQKSTILGEKYNVGKLYRFLIDIGISDIKQVDDKVLSNFRGHLPLLKTRFNKSLKTKSLNYILLSVKCFFSYLTDKGVFLTDPGIKLKVFKYVRDKIREVPCYDEVKKILDVIPADKKRDKALVEVVYSSALRISEALNLKLNNIDFDKNLITVRDGKGGKDRIVPFGYYAKECLGEYINTARTKYLNGEYKAEWNRWLKTDEIKKDVEHVFLNNWGLRLQKQHAGEIINKYYKKANLNKYRGFHLLRAASATHMFKNGCDIRIIAVMLGHKDIRSIDRYIRLNVNDLRIAIETYLNNDNKLYKFLG